VDRSHNVASNMDMEGQFSTFEWISNYCVCHVIILHESVWSFMYVTRQWDEMLVM
jgi:hypothetical protein